MRVLSASLWVQMSQHISMSQLIADFNWCLSDPNVPVIEEMGHKCRMQSADSWSAPHWHATVVEKLKPCINVHEKFKPSNNDLKTIQTQPSRSAEWYPGPFVLTLVKTLWRYKVVLLHFVSQVFWIQVFVLAAWLTALHCVWSVATRGRGIKFEGLMYKSTTASRRNKCKTPAT